jgi:hypothetical protein
MARPCKLTEELMVSLCKTLSIGVDVNTACLREGISRATYYVWRQRGLGGEGHEPEEPYAQFVEAVDKAIANAEARMLANVVKAADSDWRAAAWFLERRNREVYGSTQKVELSGTDGGAIKTQTTHRVLTPGDADEIRRKILFGENEEDRP